MKKSLFLLSFLIGGTSAAFAQQPKLTDIRFNLYADSIKPVLNYYVNVEGVYNNGRVLPLDKTDVILTADWGDIVNNEWVIPKKLEKECVIFTITARKDSSLRKEVTVYIQKNKDPRDKD